MEDNERYLAGQQARAAVSQAMPPRKRPRQASEPLELEEDELDNSAVPTSSQPPSRARRARQPRPPPRVPSPKPKKTKREHAELIVDHGIKAASHFVSNVVDSFGLLHAPRFVRSLFLVTVLRPLTYPLFT